MQVVVDFFSWSNDELFQTQYRAQVDCRGLQVQRSGCKSKACFAFTAEAVLAKVHYNIASWKLVMVCFPPDTELHTPFCEKGILLIATKRSEEGYLLAGIFAAVKPFARLEIMPCRERVGARIIHSPSGLSFRVRRETEIFYQLELLQLPSPVEAELAQQSIRKANCQLGWKNDALLLHCDGCFEFELCTVLSVECIASLLWDPAMVPVVLFFNETSLLRLVDESDQGHRIVAIDPHRQVVLIVARQHTEGEYLSTAEQRFKLLLGKDEEPRCWAV